MKQANAILTIDSQTLTSGFIELCNLSGIKVLEQKITANRQFGLTIELLVIK